jgi:hypothetical protein
MRGRKRRRGEGGASSSEDEHVNEYVNEGQRKAESTHKNSNMKERKGKRSEKQQKVHHILVGSLLEYIYHDLFFY